ncbi:MAG: glycosyltransferase [Candidatus Hydrogenedens sp.]|nr:glycosyltransferase [Candidatus Hydrogenedens sp.]
MKVCILQTLHEHDDKRVFQKVARSLVRGGHEVVSIVPDTGEVPEAADGVTFRTVPATHGLVQRFFVLPKLIAAGRRERAGVYIGVEPESWVAALICKFTTGGKAVFDMHEHVQTEFSKFFPRAMRPPVEWLTVKIMRLFARATDLIILTRESFDPPWQGLSVPRITVINTNHLQPRCAHVPEELRARYAGKRVILHQGIFGDVRGSWQLLEAMKQLAPRYPDLVCVLLGRYVYGSEQEYRDAIRDAGLVAQLQFAGVVPYDAVPAYIALSEIGLILFQPGPLNHTLAMPHKLFDYMREARPVVAPDFALEVGRIMREADCGLLTDVSDPAAIAAAIARLLDHPAEAQRLGQNGRRAVETQYHWEAEEQVLLEAFGKL